MINRIVNSPVGYGKRAPVLRCAMTFLHPPLATAVVEVTTQGVNKTLFGVALVPVQHGIAEWSTHYGHLWGSIPHPPTRGHVP